MSVTYKSSDLDIIEALRHTARSLVETAGKAATISDEDQRHREAAQVRFVATMFERDPDGMRTLALAWISAASRIVTRHNQHDREGARS